MDTTCWNLVAPVGLQQQWPLHSSHWNRKVINICASGPNQDIITKMISKQSWDWTLLLSSVIFFYFIFIQFYCGIKYGSTVYSIPLSWIECLESVIESSHCDRKLSLSQDREENRVKESEREGECNRERRRAGIWRKWMMNVY